MSDSDTGTTREAVILDFFPNGRSEEGRSQYQRQPVGYALGTDQFRLYELVFVDDADVGIGDRIAIDPPMEGIDDSHEIEYEDLSGGAQSELEYAVEDVVEAEAERFVDFFNDAQPITLRLHQLNLLPGIGKKLRNSILDERKRQPFEGFEDLEERVAGLHDPQETLVERIVEEIRDEDLKYRAFVRRDEQEES